LLYKLTIVFLVYPDPFKIVAYICGKVYSLKQLIKKKTANLWKMIQITRGIHRFPAPGSLARHASLWRPTKTTPCSLSSRTRTALPPAFFSAPPTPHT
jgi:hypothetical protein